MSSREHSSSENILQYLGHLNIWNLHRSWGCLPSLMCHILQGQEMRARLTREGQQLYSRVGPGEASMWRNV